LSGGGMSANGGRVGSGARFEAARFEAMMHDGEINTTRALESVRMALKRPQNSTDYYQPLQRQRKQFRTFCGWSSVSIANGIR
jgi:hypothetical protein